MHPELERAWTALRRHEAVVEADPTSAGDLVAIALLLSGPPIVYSGAGTLRGVEAWPRAEDAARRAIAIDPDLADAHGVLGSLAHNRDWDFPAALAILGRAVALGCSPRFSSERAVLLAQLGRDDEALLAAEEVRDPAMSQAARGTVHYLARRFPEAASAWVAPFWRGLALCALGDPEEAVRLLHAAVEGAARNPGFVALLAYAHVLAGDEPAAATLERELLSREQAGERIVPYQMATIAVARGDHDRALDLLEGSVDNRGNWLPWLARDVRFDPLRNDPRLQAIIVRVGTG